MDTKTVTLAAAILAAMGSEPFYALKTVKSVQGLVDAGHAEVNAEISEGAGAAKKVAVRLTQAGIDALNAAQATTTAPAAPAAAEPAAFAILDGVVLPPKLGREVASKYPFDKLAVGQSFFVPKTDEVKNPQRTMASTASTFAKRLKRRFTVRGVRAGVACGNFTPSTDGAFVTRLPDPVEGN